jgi:hypothetical protein
MIPTLLIGSPVLGILLISFVQSRIIVKHGMWHFGKRGFRNVYWHDRTPTERLCFWIGMFLLLLPFIVIGTWQAVCH